MANNPFRMGLNTPDIDSMLQTLRVASPSNYRNVVLLVAKRVGIKMESMIPPYPQAKKRTLKKRYTRVNKKGESYQSAFKTSKEQGYVFWALKQHIIPYKRTGLLGQSLNSEVKVTDDSVLISVGTNRSSAPQVIDENNQADIHKGTWWTLQETYRKGQGEISEFAQQQLFFAIGGNS